MRRRDLRRSIIPLVLMVTVVAGLGLEYLGRDTGQPVVVREVEELGLLHQRFQQAVALLRHGEYDFAVQGFHEVLKAAPDMPEAHVNMGYALLGLEEFAAARSFFDTASNLRPAQANAYYGMAIAHEGLGEMVQAVAAMRAYAHIAARDDPYRRKAEAAIWEWEVELSAREK